jgi:hypothetical protein
MGSKIMTKEEFKKLWEADSSGSGITYEDIARYAKEWGLFSRPKTANMDLVRYRVLKAANTKDAEEFNPELEDK